MGRHTGDYLLGTVFLVAAFLVQLSHGGVDSKRSLPIERETLPQTALAATPPAAVRAILTDLPAGTRIVVGSLDVSGKRHSIRLRTTTAATDDASLPVTRFTAGHGAGERQTCETNGATTAAYRVESSDVHAASGISTVSWNIPSHEPLSVNLIQMTEASPRVFLTPHFADTATTHEPAVCRAVGDSDRIRVFVDDRLLSCAEPEEYSHWLEVLTSAAELRALPIVETWIGAISDVDQNEKLSVVVTDLDRRTPADSGQTPILGCIRETDFCGDSDFCGDIVYVDQKIFELSTEEITALLSHEFVHAAVCSLLTDDSGAVRSTVPSWLNEAIAHFVELRCCKQSPNGIDMTENFQQRLDAFLASSEQSPIVAAENVLSSDERRSGCRCAGTLFLAPLIASPDDLRALLCTDSALDCRIENLTHNSFADVFQAWTLSVATSDNTTGLHVKSISDAKEQRCSVLGTAFQCFECSDDVSTLVIESDESAQLQVSVIEPGK